MSRCRRNGAVQRRHEDRIVELAGFAERVQAIVGADMDDIDAIHGRKPANAIIDSGVDVVTLANLDQYLADWKQMEGGR